ncbi:PIN domain-containing protein [Rhizobium hidalgonense]|uniref:Nucleic acid-binding protein n=1 Tax=Rhizobium hidalgonense TaxID=1538159 RepID=A0ABX4JN30_9HYPH|nr:PIN domain-containing protein [Rhizobium hidalgonense]PDT20373.1 nucleic acid-binding protein [Rhizobium hidalgonense]PON06616.1 nucleic acid-binding protein [Rhizobium hidalgonense]QKK27066.1 PIN domain-containing protein [Rhizobium hidalgonense]
MLDESVIRSMDTHDNVVKWKRSIDDSELAICVFTLFEKRKGAEAQLKKDPKKARAKLDAIAEFEISFGPDRILSLDAAATKEWASFVGARERHVMDAGIAAVAKTRGLIIVTRNLSDFADFRVPCLDPFRDPPFLLEYDDKPTKSK